MPIYEMSCPKCGKQSSEYDENKWKCLSCGNKFMYKDERVTQHLNATVSIQESTLFDVEPWDASCETPIIESYKDVHSMNAWKTATRKSKDYPDWFVLSLPLTGILFFLGIIGTLETSGAGAACLVLGVMVFVGSVTSVIAQKRGWKQRAEEMKESIPVLMKTVGWIALCPYCGKEHSRYMERERANLSSSSSTTHCSSCGKQFFLLNGKSHRLKRELK